MIAGAFAMAGMKLFASIVAVSSPAMAAPSDVFLPDDEESPAMISPRTLPSDPDLEMFDPGSLRDRFEMSSRPVQVLEPVVPSADIELMLEVRDLIAEGKVDAAITRLEVEPFSDTEAMTDYFLGTLHSGKSDWPAAEAAFSRACEKAPDFRRAWMQLSAVRMRQSRFEAAIPSLIRACELGAMDPITLGMLGHAHAINGDDLAAEESYRRVLLEAPDGLQGKIGLARALGVRGRHAAAASVLGRLAMENPDDPRWWFHQAVAYRKAGRIDLMAQNLEIVDGLGGSTPQSLFTLAQTYANENLWGLAVDRFLKYLQVDADSSVTLLNQPIRFMIHRNEHEPAARLIAGIWSARGEGMSARQRKDLLKLEARLAGARGDDAAEAEVLARVAELDPDDGETMLLLGNHHARQAGGLDEALAWYTRAIEFSEVATEVRLAQAEVLVRWGRVAEAVEILDESERVDPRPEIEAYRDKLVGWLRAGGGE